MALLAEVIDAGDLVQMLWTAAAAGLLVTCSFALALVGSTRALEMQRAGRSGAAAAYAAMGALALLVVVAAIVLGIVVMTTK